MNIKEIPLIITNFQQFSYLRNLVNQFHFYYPENPIIVIDNASTSKQLKDYYWKNEEITVISYPENEFVTNLTEFLKGLDAEYYCISDSDISIHPATPPNFLEYFKSVIESGYHHCGFDLIYDDIPEWNPKQKWIQGDQKELHGAEVKVGEYTGYVAPLDTSFCMFNKSNSGWSAPMDGKDWGNSVRLFKAFHLPWYLHKDHLNEEMKNYYATIKTRDNSKPSAGRSHFNPFTGMY